VQEVSNVAPENAFKKNLVPAPHHDPNKPPLHMQESERERSQQEENVSTIMSTVNIKPEVRQERTVCCSMIRSRSHLATVCVCACVFFSSLVCSVCDCDCLQLQADLLQVYLEMLRVQQNTTSILRLADHLQQVSVAPCCRTLLPVVFIPHTSRKRPASASVRSWSLLVARRSPTYLPSGSLDLWASCSFGRLVVWSFGLLLARSLPHPHRRTQNSAWPSWQPHHLHKCLPSVRPRPLYNSLRWPDSETCAAVCPDMTRSQPRTQTNSLPSPSSHPPSSTRACLFSLQRM
jgi:hypothetical protein